MRAFRLVRVYRISMKQMAVELNELRDQIDAVDKQMLDLLAQRLALVEKVGEVKREHGLPIYTGT